jgi:hypothetical protein
LQTSGVKTAQGVTFCRLSFVADVLWEPQASCISLPCGFTTAGLPIGLQLIGRPFAEADLLAAAYAYDHAQDWTKHTPNL